MKANIELSLSTMKMVKNMDFGSALTFLKEGYLVRRNSWKKNCYIILTNDSNFNFVDLDTQSTQVWDIEGYNVLASDWEFYTDHLLDATQASVETINANEMSQK